MAHIQKRQNGKYRVRYRDPKNKERSKTFDKLADAKRFQAETVAAVNNGAWVAPAKARQPFRHYAALWLNSIDVKPSTREGYESILRKWLIPEFGDVPVTAIQWHDLESFKSRLLDQDLQPSTVRNILNVVTPVLATAVRDGVIQSNPARELLKPRSAKIFEAAFATPEEVLKIAAELGGQDRLLVTFAAFSGLRAGECSGLQVRDLDLAAQRVTVRRAVTEVHGALEVTTPKNGKSRTVPIPSFLAEQLANHLKSRPFEHEAQAHVFTDSFGGIRRHSNFYRRVFRPAAEKVGLKNFRFHDLRHTYATMLISEGAHPRVVMERLGHSSISVTMDTYGHLFPTEDRATIDALEKAFRDASSNISRPVDGLQFVASLDQPTPKRRESPPKQGFSGVGLRGFEPPTFGPPDRRANQAAPQPV